MSFRLLNDHKVGGANENVDIYVFGERGPGNANHDYRVLVWNSHFVYTKRHDIQFQKGPVPEVGNNGLTNESLLAIVADRLRGFQSSEYKCKENACALTRIEEALMWLQKRTRERIERGVEGTHEK